MIVVTPINGYLFEAHNPFEIGAAQHRQVELLAPRHGAIEGRVLGPRRPLSDAEVVATRVGEIDSTWWRDFYSPSNPSSRAEPDGAFRIDLLPEAACELSLHLSSTRVGDPRSWIGWSGQALRLGAVELQPSDATQVEFDVTLRIPCGLGVTVRMDGEPALGIGVLAHGAPNEPTSLASHLCEFTGTDGREQFRGLQPGRWRAEIASYDRLWCVTSVEPPDLAPGEAGEVTLDIRFHAGTLRVCDAATVLPLADRRLEWSCEGRSTSVSTNMDGALDMRLPAGRYRVSREPRIDSGSASPTSFEIEWAAGRPSPHEIRL